MHIASWGLAFAAAAMACVTVRAQQLEPTLELTLYTAECGVALVGSKCPEGRARPLHPETFTLYPKSQRVRMTWPTLGYGTTWADHCVIRDVDNWTCMYDDNSGVFGVLDRNYWHVGRRIRVFDHGVEVDPSEYEIVSYPFYGPQVYITKEQYDVLVAEFGLPERRID